MTLRSPSRRSGAGFTLLEILVAVAVLGVALVTLLGLHARNIRLAARTDDLTRAGLLASQLVAITRAALPPSVGRTSGRFTENERAALDVNTVFGGPGSERFVWEREVIAVAQVGGMRAVTIRVGESEEEPIVELRFALPPPLDARFLGRR
jgi:prepilin-type N-terminal cleavage/methylation domain-containing protein